ncbi:unnamed protein product [Absidia cylindrospora]
MARLLDANSIFPVDFFYSLFPHLFSAAANTKYNHSLMDSPTSSSTAKNMDRSKKSGDHRSRHSSERRSTTTSKRRREDNDRDRDDGDDDGDDYHLGHRRRHKSYGEHDKDKDYHRDDKDQAIMVTANMNQVDDMTKAVDTDGIQVVTKSAIVDELAVTERIDILANGNGNGNGNGTIVQNHQHQHGIAKVKRQMDLSNSRSQHHQWNRLQQQ